MADARHRLTYRVRYALRHPERIWPYLRRWWRDIRFRVSGRRDHVSFYREVMRDDASQDPQRAVGSATHSRWLALGELQFEYLVEHGLAPHHDLLEIGCGNLRAGWRLVRYLEAGRYHGIDISPDILLAANRTVVGFGLQEREPQLRLVDDLTFDWLPDNRFDVVHAHSVFSHCPIGVIDECFGHVGRILRPGGWFDLTFNATAGREHHVLHEDYYYRPRTLSDLARGHGLRAEVMEDWASRHKQAKLRLRHHASGEIAHASTSVAPPPGQPPP